jgi:tripartite ATP-independent transporter DctP family solute receptor
MRVLTLAGGLTGALLLAGTAGAQSLELNFGTVNDPGGMQYLSAEEWAKRVNEALGDQGKVEVFGSSQLGTDQEMLQKLKLGTLDFSQPSTIMSTVVPQFGLFDMPYLVKDRAHADCIAKEIIWPELAPMVEAEGYKLIGVWENGFRQITNNVRPINAPEDLKDIKLRTPRGVWRVKMFESYGANPTPMSFSELFVALQTGVVDGQENPVGVIYSAKLFEVQDYLMLTGHIMQNQVVIINESFFHSLSPEHRQVLEDAVIEAGDYQNALIEAGAKEDLAKLKEAGMTVIEPDIEAFRAATADIYLQFEDQWGKGLFERMRAAGS